jgi:peptide deformylase
MFDLMYEHRGVGLAANQVDLPYRLFVVNESGDYEQPGEERVFINPVLSGFKGQVEDEEGCLSIPGVYGQVMRAERVTVNAYDLAGQEFRGEVEGLLARIVQHETDHLDGRLFIDRLSPTEAADVREKLEELELNFRSQRDTGAIPSDKEITARLDQLEKQRA